MSLQILLAEELPIMSTEGAHHNTNVGESLRRPSQHPKEFSVSGTEESLPVSTTDRIQLSISISTHEGDNALDVIGMFLALERAIPLLLSLDDDNTQVASMLVNPITVLAILSSPGSNLEEALLETAFIVRMHAQPQSRMARTAWNASQDI